MASRSAALAGLALIAAGVYQWTPLKQSCLRHCRSQLDFLLRHWRKGTLGPVGSGLRHGAFCLGCCWVLMVLLFVGGLMNILWLAGLALLVLIDKTLPWGNRTSHLTGMEDRPSPMTPVPYGQASTRHHAKAKKAPGSLLQSPHAAAK